ncbi:TPA: hypothetical protein RK000_005105 [Escherichia coli]|uniref:hypothetical protein n=1 Tax=Escherichia coli TaxID=562 RepID=UPI00130243E4|nr:hypothetical protein [Escherichia coli]KAE9932198.1 hypothetical protein GP685_23610 [Escherichia coli]MWK27564.1 hypothetical protein [Escherichia coli]MWM95423.1 hypothetical protein [Escherichia coli]MXF23639.1 hypothetical protein [Escherichia coli]HAV9200984.1 hypothetical protein [Escherichia coli]
MLTGAFLYLPLVFMPEADSLKHPQQFYLTLLFPQTVFIPSGNVLPMWEVPHRSEFNQLKTHQNIALPSSPQVGHCNKNSKRV